MDKDEQLIDSLLKEHAKSKGMDEQFLTEVEEKIDIAERGNIIDLNRDKPNSQANWKKGVGIGVAACAAFYVAGSMIWNKENRVQDVVLDNASADKQIEDAMLEAEEVDLYVVKPKIVSEVEKKGSASVAPAPSSSSAKVIGKDSVNRANAKSLPAVPAPFIPSITSNEPALDFGKGDDFGVGWGNAGAGKDSGRTRSRGVDAFADSVPLARKSKQSPAALRGRQGLHSESERRVPGFVKGSPNKYEVSWTQAGPGEGNFLFKLNGINYRNVKLGIGSTFPDEKIKGYTNRFEIVGINQDSASGALVEYFIIKDTAKTEDNEFIVYYGKKIERIDHIKENLSTEKYGALIENSFISPSDKESRRSTFAVDVDTASYANMRKMIQNGRTVPADSVRIEEMVNYFDYQYAKPGENAEHPFAVQVDSVSCPWNAKNKLVRVALQGKEIIRDERPASNLVFLLDVSGSMNNSDKLPLLKQSLKYLLEEMDERDSVSVVVYAGASGLVLPATKADGEGRVKILQAMDTLSSGGSTAGGAGIKLAYKIAQENFIKDGVNRVILATDGDFNVGVSGTAALTDLVKEKAKKGVDISVLGFGSGNLNDEMLESITNKGNGNYSYIDTIKEGRKVLLEDMTGTLVTIAKDVKIQVEFNPEQVKEYRLIGYANRKLPNSAFLDKKADAGEIGAGHSVTAFYEIVPGKAVDKSKLNELRYTKPSDSTVAPEGSTDASIAKKGMKHADELLFVKLAYKQPQAKINDESIYLSVPLKVNDKDWKQADEDFKFASSVALFGMVLRDSDYLGDGNLELVQQLAESGKSTDGKGYREEFIKIVKKMKDRE